MPNKSLTFIVAVNDSSVLRTNFLASPILSDGTSHQVVLQKGFSSAGSAYNSALELAENDLVVFVHQDVFFPAGWDIRLFVQIAAIEAFDTNWGVIGCVGVSSQGETVGHAYCNSSQGEVGKPSCVDAVEVRSLDEFVLAFRKSSGIVFDENLPHFHFYGTDVCLSSQSQGLKNYAINNFCVHNAMPVIKLPKEFWLCCKYMTAKWTGELPVRTTCTILTSSFRLRLFLRLRSRWSSFRRVMRGDSSITRTSTPHKVVPGRHYLPPRDRPVVPPREGG